MNVQCTHMYDSLLKMYNKCIVLCSLVVLRLVVLSTNTHDPDLRSESCLYLESTATRRTTIEDNLATLASVRY